MTAWIAGAEIKGVVFIDSMVPDLQTLLGGVAPDERAFVLDMSGGGLEQIAAILAANHLTDVGSIAIVGHGASGSINVGTTVLNDGDLAAHAAALKTIGAAVAPGGSLDLYSCATAAGPQGRAFIADLSKAAGVTVDASTKEIGRTAGGENWTLDISTKVSATIASMAKPLAPGDSAQPATAAEMPATTNTPFRAATIQSYQGTLSASSGPDGQLTFVGAQTGYGFGYANAGSTSSTLISPNDVGGVELVEDNVLGIDFQLKPVVLNGVQSLALYTGSTNSSSPSTRSTQFDTYYQNTVLAGDPKQQNTEIGQGLAVDPASHTVYLPVGSANTAMNGFIAATYSYDGSTVNLSNFHYLETSAGNVAPSFPQETFYSAGNLYFVDADEKSFTENGLFRVSTTANSAPVRIVAQSQFPAGLNNANATSQIRNVVEDAADNRAYFAVDNLTVDNNGVATINSTTLYSLNNASTVANGTATQITFSSGQLSGKEVSALAYDNNSSTLYAAIETNSSTSNPDYSTSVIDVLHLDSTGTKVTSMSTIPFGGSSAGNPPFTALAFDSLSALTLNGTAATVAETGARTTLLTGVPGITDFNSGGYLSSVSVGIVDSGATVVAGDVLGITNGSTFTTFSSTATAYTDHGNSFLVSYANGTLTIANQAGSASERTIGAYQQVLEDVQYQGSSTDYSTRTATVQVNDGGVGNPSGPINAKSFTLAVAQPPTIVSGGYKVPADVVAGGTASATAPGALTGDTSPASSGTLSVSAVQGAAGNVGNPVTGTYGSLTLQSNGAYSYTAGNTTAIANAATGAHPVDSYNFTVSNAGGTATEAFAATIDRAPTGTADMANATELGPAVTGNVLTNDSDPDGDALTVASVSFNGTAGTVGQSVTGTYGTLTLNANGTYSYTANNAVAYATNSPPRTDTFTYTDSDGLGGTSAATPLVFNVTCFASGTRIRVARGDLTEDVAVEALRVGDLAVTTSGAHRPIRWIGSRLTQCRRHPRPGEAMPVRVAAGAFGTNRPERDLLLSPGHSLCVDVVGEVLIPAMALINGTTITQEDVDAVTYWHVELESHDILLAENMPAESYIEMGNRGFFSEAEVVALDASPDVPVATHADFCRPFHAAGALVAVVRAQLAARAENLGWRLEERGLGDLHLVVDGMRIEPRVRGLAARFAVPAGAASVWLVSDTTVPADIASGSPDHRALGVSVVALTLDAGFGAPRSIAIDDPRLCVGFHEVERDGDNLWRWTAGRARLPTSLWEGLDDDLYLRVDLTGPALPRWVAPVHVGEDRPLLAWK